MIEIFIPLLFAITTLLSLVFIYRVVTAVEAEDRTYADKPPNLFRWIWPAITFVTFYVGGYLSVEYREKKIRRLRKAELDYALSPQQWFAAKLVYGVIIGFGLFLFASSLGSGSWTSILVGGFLGFVYLELWLRDRIKQIEIQVLKNLPNFLDMLTLAVESGCNLTVGITIGVEKTPDNPLRRGFARLLREIRSGRSRIDALRSLEDRLNLPALTSLTSALVQAEKTGASLGAVLRSQSTQRTNERFSRAEKLAMEAPVKMLGPLILCIFPCTFVVLGFPIGMKMMSSIQ